MRTRTWLLACGLALGVVTSLMGQRSRALDTVVGPSSGRSPAHVTVIGDDYTFVQFPSTIAAGQTSFSFENRGRVRHEMSMVLLKPGVTPQQVLERGPNAAASRAMADRLIGILIARPAESSGGQLLVELQSGQRYLVVCTLKDAPDARPHIQLGMVTSFDVP
jgi:hypothetical protein